MKSIGPRIIVALDFPDKPSCMLLVDQLDPSLCRLKVGKELFTLYGPDMVRSLVSKGFDVFLDLKYHDIPNTVARACMAAADLGVWMLNVHSMGGAAMMQAARDTLSADDAPLLIAVTLLTSSGEKELAALGIKQSPAELVARLAGMAQQAGLDGVVCSAQEASMLKPLYGDAFKLVTPGIRLETDAKDDQQRVMTPQKAIQSGADYLVIGRPITQAAQPVEVLRQIVSSIA